MLLLVRRRIETSRVSHAGVTPVFIVLVVL
jgi:hypothetical protein